MRRSARRLCQRADDCPSCQVNLEGIVGKAFCVVQQHVGCPSEGRRVRFLPAQRTFRQRVPPRLVRYAAERQAGFSDPIALKFQCRGNRHQRERIGKAITDFQVSVVGPESLCWKLHRRDELVRLEVRVALGRVQRESMEVRKRNRAFARGPYHLDFGVQGGERNAHVGGMRRDASLARPEDCVHSVEAIYGRAAAARLALVTGRRGVVEIVAARPLQEITAGRSHIPQLLRGAGEDGAAEHWIALLDERMIGEIGIRHERADAHTAVRGFLDLVQRQPRDVDQPRGPFDIFLHQVDQVGAAGDEFRARVAGDLSHRVGHVACPSVLEIDHDWPIACSIAATMFG